MTSISIITYVEQNSPVKKLQYWYLNDKEKYNSLNAEEQDKGFY